MSGDVGAEVAAVLAAHEADVTSYDAGDIHGCRCGWALTREQQHSDDYGWGAHRTHVADALAPLIAVRVEAAKVEALREAADELLTTADDLRGGVGHESSYLNCTLIDVKWLRDRAAALDPGARP